MIVPLVSISMKQGICSTPNASAVLAYNALPKQPEGVQKKTIERLSSFLLFGGRVVSSYAIGENKYPRDISGVLCRFAIRLFHRDSFCQTALRGLAVEARQIVTRFVHHLYDLVERYKV